MKSRLLKQILNNTGYTVADYGNYIAIGSPLCHDLIKVEKESKRITYALDTWRQGRKALDNKEELAFIWDKLSELIASGDIDAIMTGEDILENPLPVFTCNDGVIVETVTDAYGWPNVTKEGWIMYDNTYFRTRQEAIDYGIRDLFAWIDMLRERRSELAVEIQKISDELEAKIYKHEELLKLKANEEGKYFPGAAEGQQGSGDQPARD